MIRYLAIALLAASVLPAFALINVRYTPVDLVRGSRTIATANLGPLGDDARVAVAVREALKGDAPAITALEVGADVADAFRQVRGDAKAMPALLFLGDFSAAVEGAGDAHLVGALRVGMAWFALSREGDGLLTGGPDPNDLGTVWAGGDDMLARAVRYIVADPRADIPATARTSWSGDAKVAVAPGALSGLLAVDLDGAGKPLLHLLSAAGDRLYRVGGDGAWEDVTAANGLTARSRAALWCDLDRDGRLDVVSWDGAAVAMHIRDAAGAFTRVPAAMWPCDDCVGLALTSAGVLVAGLEPVLLTRDARTSFADGKPIRASAAGDVDGDGACDVLAVRDDKLVLFSAGAAPATAATADALPDGVRALRLGDFDGDGLPDVAAAGAGGFALYRNLGAGRFQAGADESGEAAYDPKPGIIALGTFDVNADGRDDLYLAYPNMPPQFFFNRGFACFGLSGDLALREWGVKAAGTVRDDIEFRSGESLRDGQQAAASADFNGDGAIDMALVARDGQVWTLWGTPDDVPEIGLTVRLAAAAGGPVTLTARDGARPISARVLMPGESVFLFKPNKGPLTLHWSGPALRQQTDKVVPVFGRTTFNIGG